MKKIATIFVFQLIGFAAFCQLDQSMNQSIAIPGMEFKALAGQHKGVQVNLAYQNKYPAIPANFVTYFANADGYNEKLKMGFGVNASLSNVGNGVINHNYIESYFNRAIEIKKGIQLIPSINVSANQRNIEWSKMTLSDQLPSYFLSPNTPTTSNINHLSLGIGTALKTEHFNFAANIDQLNRPDISFYASIPQKLPIMVAVTSGYRFDINENWHILPRVTYRKVQEFQQTVVAMNISRKDLSLAGSFDSNRQMAFALAYDIKGVVRLNYNYALATGDMGVSSGGTHELGLRIWLQKKRMPESRITNNIGIL